MAEYHNYVFDVENREFVGQFNEMFNAEEDNYFNSWHQEDMWTIGEI